METEDRDVSGADEGNKNRRQGNRRWQSDSDTVNDKYENGGCGGDSGADSAAGAVRL